MSKGPLVLSALVVLAVGGLIAFDLRPELGLLGATPLKVHLKRGPLTIYDYPSLKPTISAVIIFGSGDGGWGSLEKSICHGLQEQGFRVAGIDFTAYAERDYDLDTLQSDYATIAAAMRATIRGPQPPLIIGGYSMGAAQAIAAAGGPNPPPGLAGLLVVDPLSRGRYGLREADQLNVLPEGVGTFSVVSFAGTMRSLHVVQWHAQNDAIDSHAWLDSLRASYRFFTFAEAGHGYVVNREQFVQQLVQSVPWILDDDSSRTATAATNR